MLKTVILEIVPRFHIIRGIQAHIFRAPNIGKLFQGINFIQLDNNLRAII